MKGTCPLDNDEIRRVSAAFTGTFEARNRGLFMLGVSTTSLIGAASTNPTAKRPPPFQSMAVQVRTSTTFHYHRYRDRRVRRTLPLA